MKVTTTFGKSRSDDGSHRWRGWELERVNIHKYSKRLRWAKTCGGDQRQKWMWQDFLLSCEKVFYSEARRGSLWPSMCDSVSVRGLQTKISARGEPRNGEAKMLKVSSLWFWKSSEIMTKLCWIKWWCMKSHKTQVFGGNGLETTIQIREDT